MTTQHTQQDNFFSNYSAVYFVRDLLMLPSTPGASHATWHKLVQVSTGSILS